MKTFIVARLQEKDQVLSADSESVLKEQIVSLANKDAPVRKLMWKRLIAYVRLVKTGKTLPPAPPGYTDMTEELQTLASKFKRLTIYNYSVFGEHCEKLLDQITESLAGTSAEAGPSTSNANASASTAAATPTTTTTESIASNEPAKTSNAST